MKIEIRTDSGTLVDTIEHVGEVTQDLIDSLDYTLRVVGKPMEKEEGDP